MWFKRKSIESNDDGSACVSVTKTRAEFVAEVRGTANQIRCQSLTISGKSSSEKSECSGKNLQKK